MNVLTRLVLISLYVGAQSIFIRRMFKRHSDYDVEPYGQIVYAAIPLNGPVPVLQVLSRRPLSYDDDEPSDQHSIYVRPRIQSEDYGPSGSAQHEYEYTEREYDERAPYPKSHRYGPTHTHFPQGGTSSASASEDDVTIIYARPNPNGGFSYRRRKIKAPPKRTVERSTESPVILRVHKYKATRE